LRAEAVLASRRKRARGGLAQHPLAQHLDGHAAFERGVVGTVDDTHPASPELRVDSIVAERLADHGDGLEWAILGRR
jgi:hypothetical protein